MTAALEGGEWSAARPGRTLPTGKTRYPLYRSLGGPQGRSGREENLVPTGIRSRTVQPVVAIPTELPGPLYSRKPSKILGTKKTVSTGWNALHREMILVYCDRCQNIALSVNDDSVGTRKYKMQRI